MVDEALRISGSGRLRRTLANVGRGVAGMVLGDADFVTSSRDVIGTRRDELKQVDAMRGNSANAPTIAALNQMMATMAAMEKRLSAKEANAAEPVKVRVEVYDPRPIRPVDAPRL